MKFMPLILTMLIMLLAAEIAQAQDEGRFVQDRFAIGFWVDPPADQITDERYREIAEAHFNFVLGPFGPKNAEDVAKQLDLCEKYDMKTIVKVFEQPENLPEHPACWGYYIVDEPGAGGIPDIKARIDTFRKHRPGKLAYFNLLPNYATPGQLGAANYDEYIRRFARETGCEVLCMDYYPMLTPTADGRDGYCGNLEVMRKYALEMDIPHWNFFNIMPFGPHHDPAESHVRWQIFTSLAYGSKGVLYFCYWTPRGGEFPKGGAIIAADGQRTRHYDQARRINFAVKNLGPTLMKLTSTDVIRVKPGEDAADKLKNTPIKNITGGGDYLVGVFKHSDGRHAVLLNNYDHNYTAWPTVEFAAEKVVEVDQSDGREKPLRDDSPDMEGIQLSFDAGEGRLFLF